MWILRLSGPEAASVVEDPGFTGETLFVLFTVTLAGIPLGLPFVAVARWIPGHWIRKGLAFGVLLLLFLGLPVMLIQKEYSAGPPQLARVLFGALFISYGVVAAWTKDRLDRSWPATSERRVLPVVGFVLLVMPGLLGLPLGLMVLGWH